MHQILLEIDGKTKWAIIINEYSLFDTRLGGEYCFGAVMLTNKGNWICREQRNIPSKPGWIEDIWNIIPEVEALKLIEEYGRPPRQEGKNFILIPKDEI